MAMFAVSVWFPASVQSKISETTTSEVMFGDVPVQTS